jgi:inhibitor of KinA sporulation pathway (predicted exonuclease)
MSAQLVLFDFEYTAWEGSWQRKWSGPGEQREIIQIAAIRVSADAQVDELACFDCLVRPAVNVQLSAYIRALTGIEQAAVDAHGLPFGAAWEAFYAFCDQGRLPLFCYGDDVSVLNENYALNGLAPERYPLHIADIRQVFGRAGIDTRSYTSGTVHQALGLKLEAAAHNALNDVRSLAATLRELARRR